MLGTLLLLQLLILNLIRIEFLQPDSVFQSADEINPNGFNHSPNTRIPIPQMPTWRTSSKVDAAGYWENLYDVPPIQWGRIDCMIADMEWLYAGGSFNIAGGNPNAKFIARWNGSHWYALGEGLNNFVAAMVFKESHIIAGGHFKDAGGQDGGDYIAGWDGNSWYPLGTGFNDPVFALAVCDSGLIAGGKFTNAGGDTLADFIAWWNGSEWYPLGAGLNNPVYALAVCDSGIFAGGKNLLKVEEGFYSNVIFWNGNTWKPVGKSPGTVFTMAKTDSCLFVGGKMDPDLMQWDGKTWKMTGKPKSEATYSLFVSDSGLYVGGTNTYYSEKDWSGIGFWDGTNWKNPTDQYSQIIYAIAGSNNQLFISGNIDIPGYSYFKMSDKNKDLSFQKVKAIQTDPWFGHPVAVLREPYLLPLGTGRLFELDDLVKVGNYFIFRRYLTDLLLWNGSTRFRDIGYFSPGTNDVKLVSYRGNLIVAGYGNRLNINNDKSLFHLFDGKNWMSMPVDSSVFWVNAISSFDQDLMAIARYRFSSAGTLPDGIIRWKGNQWEPVGKRLKVNQMALAIWNGQPVTTTEEDDSLVIVFDGNEWKPLRNRLPGSVYSLLNEDSVLIALWSSWKSGKASYGLSILKESTWHSLGKPANDKILTVKRMDSVWYVGGKFTQIDNNPDAKFLARWDGQHWHALGQGVDGEVFSLIVDENSLYVAGKFNRAGDFYGQSVARWIHTLEKDSTNFTDEPPKVPLLNQNYPNPFNGSTTLSFHLPRNSPVLLQVFDMTGKRVSTLVNRQMTSGVHKIRFSATGLASGVYFYRFQTDGYSSTKTMILLK